MEVAENAHCPPHVLEKLVYDKIHLVRIKAAKNKNMPDHMIKSLIKHPDIRISKLALVEHSKRKNKDKPCIYK